MDNSTLSAEEAAVAERSRLAELRSYEVLDSPPEAAFDAIVRAAAEIAGLPTSTVTMIDSDRQWYKARHGTDDEQTPRDIAFCDHVVRSGAVLEVPDTLLDPRFATNPLVTGPPHLRSYFGFPLRTPTGAVLGTLCVMGPQPHTLADSQRRLLTVLTDQVMSQLELRRRIRLAETLQVRIVQSEARYRSLVEQTPDAIVVTVDDEVVFANESAAALFRTGRPGDLHGVTLEAQEGCDGDALCPPVGSDNRTRRTRLLRADATWVSVDVTAARTDYEGRAAVQCVIRDVSDLEALNAALAAERDDAERRTAFVQTVLDTIDVAVVACDEAGALTMFNRTAREFHGMPEDPSLTPAELAGAYSLWEEDGTTALTTERVPLLEALHGEPVRGRHIMVAPDGLPARTLRCDARALADSHGRAVGAVVAMKDVTAARASEKRYRAAFLNGPTPMAHLSVDGALLDANPALRRFLGRPTGNLVGRPLRDLAHPDDQPQLETAMQGSGTGTEPVEARFLRLDGAAVWCELATTIDLGLDGVPYVLAQLVDVHARKQHEMALRRAALHDRLTGAANRQVLDERLEELLDPGLGPGALLLFADLDGFKSINDTYGHEAGDAVLVEVARRLMSLVRPQDCVVRLGGDEFVVLCPRSAIPAGTAVAALTRRISEALAAPVDHAGVRLQIGVSIGSAIADAGQLPAAVLERADRSMYVEKKRQRASATR